MNGWRISTSFRVRSLFGLSLLAAGLAAALALVGLLFQGAVYPTETLRSSFVSNDLVTLVIGLPVLLGSLALAWRGRLAGLLFWPGALLMVVYNAVAYAVSLPPGLLAGANLALAALSVFGMACLLASVDAAQVRERLQGRVPARLVAGVLIGFGVLFFIQQAASLGSLRGPELGTAVADLLITPLWCFGGILLWRRRAFGYVLGAGLLFQACMLFVGLLAYFLVQPLLGTAPFRAADFFVVLLMSLICFIPFGLFVRGTVQVEGPARRLPEPPNASDAVDAGSWSESSTKN